MLALSILAGIVGWLILGVMVVAITVALELTDVIDPDKASDTGCALVLWPICIVVCLVVLLGKLAVWVGELLRP